MTQNISSVSIKLSDTMHMLVMKQVIEDGYGMRGKSKWVNDAITRFLAIDCFPVLVDELDDDDDYPALLTLRLPEDTCKLLEQSVIVIRKENPMIEGVKSKIVRASILQRLLKKIPPAEIYVTC
jgi:hypothetical protein